MLKNKSNNTSEEIAYPAEFHFRVICDANADITADICSAAAAHRVTSELKDSNTSSSGKFRSYSLSIIFNERNEMTRFDETIKAIPGVRMLL